jgi:uncharacterized membrane protein
VNGAPLPEWVGTAAIAAGLVVTLPALAAFLWHDRRRK